MNNLQLWVEPSFKSLIGFGCILTFVCVAFVGAVRNSSSAENRRRATAQATASLACWLLLTGLYSWMGMPSRGLPFLLVLMAGSNLAAVVLAISSVGRQVALNTPLAALVGFQAFRLPLEIILHRWSTEGVIPISMTWSGQNYDIVSGVLAVLATLIMVLIPRMATRIALVFGGIGSALLLNVARVAVLSSPGPQRIFGDPPLLLAMHLPEVWIVPVCVAGALFGHIVLFRALWMRW